MKSYTKKSNWREILSNSITTADYLSNFFSIDINKINKVINKYPMKINPYYLSLIKNKNDPLWNQAVPDIKELEKTDFIDDPLFEDIQSPVPNLTHRYPDRVLFIVSNQCAMYCRHCMRKRTLSNISYSVTKKTIYNGVEYIKNNKKISEVIISGGDPLFLDDGCLSSILYELRKISHIEVIRIHTRMPCTLPQRITQDLVNMLKKFHPIYINTQFNHPDEITEESSKACTMIADAGIPIGCQTVLLKGINDNFEVMKDLMKKLIKIRVKPYYLHHPDPVKGTEHFRIPIKKGLDIMQQIRGNISGMCIPQYMIDIPKGGGKIPLLPEYIKSYNDGILKIYNYKQELFEYIDK